MNVFDLHGSTVVESEAQLLDRLETVRSGSHASFMLYHDQLVPCLYVHIFEQFAYLHYFPEGESPDEAHPGFQPSEMTPPATPETVKFVMTNGMTTIEMPANTICGIDDAYRAAVEFFQSPRLPNCINWFEL
jgi:hypothetical protein